MLSGCSQVPVLFDFKLDGFLRQFLGTMCTMLVILITYFWLQGDDASEVISTELDTPCPLCLSTFWTQFIMFQLSAWQNFSALTSPLVNPTVHGIFPPCLVQNISLTHGFHPGYLLALHFGVSGCTKGCCFGLS